MESKVNQQEVEKKLYSRNFAKYGLDLNPVVSFSSGLIILIFSFYAIFNLDKANRALVSLQNIIISRLDWLFLLSSSFFIIICLYFALSRLGEVRIGGINTEPEFSNFGWYSMLISAGMGIGLMFWAVGEPLYHFVQQPPIFTSSDSAQTAMAATFFHWGLHPWGIYALVALGLAFFAYNKKLPLSLRSVFYPLFKERVYGTLGDIIDILAVLSTLFGLAASLGMGAQQINSGLDYITGIGSSVGLQILLIAIITIIATVSIVSGIDKGIKFLSELNIKLAVILMAAILILGPTEYILRLFSNSLGLYFNQIIQYATFVSLEENAWQVDWTVFYLAWWISWSPFVGMFIARISKGRTVRELILGVLVVPSLLSFFWLSVFGGSAISLNSRADGSLFAMVQDNVPIALYEMINLLNIPVVEEVLRMAMYILVTILVVTYFVTSSDSGSLVLDKITCGGKLDSPGYQKVFWAFLEGLIAATLLLIGGEKALSTLQTAVISAGLPLAVLLLVMVISLLIGLKSDLSKQNRLLEEKKFKQLSDIWEERLPGNN